MKVKIYCINAGTSAQYYGLMTADDNTPICNAKAWRTIKGAVNWARKHGFEI